MFQRNRRLSFIGVSVFAAIAAAQDGKLRIWNLTTAAALHTVEPAPAASP